MRRDFKKFHIEEDGWYGAARDRGLWRAIYREGLSACAKERLERDKMRREGASVGVLGRQSKATLPSAWFVCDTCHKEDRTSPGINVRELKTEEGRQSHVLMMQDIAPGQQESMLHWCATHAADHSKGKMTSLDLSVRQRVTVVA